MAAAGASRASGKTSLFQLLLRYYEVSGGAILLNGQDLRQLALDDLRGSIAIVPQDPVIFSANALDNIRYGRAGASDEEVMAAARTALPAQARRAAATSARRANEDVAIVGLCKANCGCVSSRKAGW